MPNIQVRPVALYVCETWKMTKGEEKKLDVFRYKWMRRNLGIRWSGEGGVGTVVRSLPSNPKVPCSIPSLVER